MTIDSRGRPAIEPVLFIRANMPVAPVPGLPEITLHTAHPASGLRRLAGRNAGGRPPYWAYHWPGGAALARHFLDRPESVAGRSVLDLGAGSGLVGIAAAIAGAGKVIASEIDPNGVAAIGLNAAVNDVPIVVIADDLTAGPPPAVDLVAAGDLFYEPELALRVTAFLDRCLAAGIDVLIGDIGRAHLPRSRLRLLAEYPVAEFGETRDVAARTSAVYALEPHRQP